MFVRFLWMLQRRIFTDIWMPKESKALQQICSDLCLLDKIG